MSTAGRPNFGPDLLVHVVAAYGIGITTEPQDLGGSSSLNVGVDEFVIRVHRHDRSAARLEAMQVVRVALHDAGLPFVTPLTTGTGESWVRWRGHLVEVEPRAAGEDMESWGQLLTGMHMLGRVHEALASLQPPEAARYVAASNQISVTDAQSYADAAIRKIRLWPELTDAELRFAEMTAQHAMAVAEKWGPYRERLPRQLVHGDFWHNNVLFEQADITAILDLDFMSERERIDDLALILYYVNSGTTLPPDLTVEQRRRRLRELVDAYDAAAVPPLSRLEREALPLVLARIMLKYTRYLSQIESVADQRAVLAAEWPELAWSSAIVSRLPDWQEAFA